MTKLLLVEDDNNLREIYEARLQAEGYTIVSAHDGEEALVVAKAEKPDLIISDIMMPKISGFEMLDILRNTDGLRDVKVIMLTALGQSDDQQRADRLGADRYLVKSQVTLEDIVKVAHELLGENGTEEPADTTPISIPASPVTESPAAPADPMPVAESAPAPADPIASTPAPIPEPTASSAPVTSIPVASEPPVSDTPAPAPVSDTPAETDATSDATKTATADATSSATEEAQVEAQIEDFVAGASEIATAPIDKAAELPSETEPEAEVIPEPTPDQSSATEHPVEDTAAAVAADQKLVDDAADTLEASTKAAEEAKVQSETEASVASDESDKPQQKKVGGERVIEPIEGEPKKDIGTLLALEEAKEAAAAPAAGATPVIVDDKAGPQAPGPVPAPTDGVDPNSISL